VPFRDGQAGGVGQGKSQQSNGKARKVQPKPPDKEKPSQALPNLDELRGHRENHPEIKPAVESTVRSKRKPLQKWDGRKVGDPGTTTSNPQTRSQRSPRQMREDNNGSTAARFNHSRKSAAAPPPLPDDNFVASFVGNAMGRGISGPEQVYWDDVLRSAYYQGPDALIMAAREMGRTIFQSKEYYDRGRSNHDYVYDLYMTYLMRDPGNPNDGGWDFWTSVCDSSGREAVRAAFDACGDFNTLVGSLTPNGGITGGVGSISSARVDPFNQSGDQIQARDAEWGLPLINLPGRAGLDLGLGLSYSSLVWTKSGPYLYFDEDISQISPGFHLGFASIQGPYFDALTHKKVYMLVSSSGQRTELRQVGDGAYEAADSSHLQLLEGGHSMAQEVNWTNVSGVAVNGSTLAATYGYWAAGASSTQTIASGDGYVETTIGETNTYRMIGLANGDSNQSYVDIDFAWYAVADGNLQIYESGAYVGSFGPYAIGDGLRVAVEGGQVKYRKNGQLLYTSTHAPTYPLVVDTSFYNPGSTLNNVVIGNGGVTAPSGTLLLCAADGTRIQYSSYASDWQATQVKDRNGNYLTIANDWRGDIQTITDTLGRVIYFNNDGNGNLNSITQYTGAGWQTLASFGWGAPQSMSVWNMSGVVGTYQGESVPVLRQVNLMDGSFYTFDYTGVGQVNVIHRYASDSSPQSYVIYDYDGATADCPRINQTREWAYGWNGYSGVPGEVATQFDVVGGNGHRMITPDGTNYIEYYGTGWQNGLVTDARVYVGGGLQRQSTAAYTQDDTGINYQDNPRVAETNVYDAIGNRRRTTIDYTGSFGLPGQVTEFDSNASSILRYTSFEYVDDSYYTSRRIIGLTSRETLYNGSGGVEARTSYGYDAGSINAQAQYATQHDYIYDTNYYARGNVTNVFRWDAGDPDNQSKRLNDVMTYDAAGNLLTTADPLSHTTTLNYGDSFSDSTFHNAYAYPGILTDPDGYSSYVQYNYDFGAKTRSEAPAPAGQSVGGIQYFYYDGARRPYEIYNGNLGSATYFAYGPNYTQTWKSVNSVYDNYSIRYVNGVGQENAVATLHSSTGTYGTRLTYYDVMGRVSQQSNPTEMYGNWSPSADEAGGWIYTYQTYDWKGRPLVTTNQDGKQKYASYNDCGCAGSEIATITDERGRQHLIYSDVLGRQWKTEILNWNGSSYSTTVSYLNARDQAYLVRRSDSATGAYQDNTMTYDGYGRLKTQHAPEQQDQYGNPTNTTWEYNPDDTVSSLTDARGAVATYGYNNRHQVTSVSQALSGYATINLGYGYDAAGNRTSMSHSVGGAANDSASYGYDSLSRMISETRHINALEGYYPNYGSFSMSYGYNFGGELQNVTDAFGAATTFTYDNVGRTASVTGTYDGGNYTYVSSVGYRAWGAVKAATFGVGSETASFNSRMQPTQYSGAAGLFDYSYYDDGRLQQLHDQNDRVGDPHFVTFHYMSRVYSYDQSARVSSVGPMPNNNAPAPFTGNYGYDAFDNMNSRSGQYALNAYQSDTATFTNNRRNGWNYNYDGQVTSSTDNSDSGGSSTRSWTYDAAGKLITTSEVRNSQTSTNTLTYDGDGQIVNEAVNGSSAYLIRSSVLGTVMNRLSSTGAKDVTYVPTNGLVAPIQYEEPGYGSYLSWIYHDASGLQENGTASDPLGNWISNTQPPVQGPPSYIPFTGGDLSGFSNFYNNANNFSGGCLWDGQPKDCNWVKQHFNDGWGNINPIITDDGHTQEPPGILETRTREGYSRSFINGSVFGDDPNGPQNPTPTPTSQRTPIYCRPDVIKAMNTAWSQSGNAGEALKGGSMGVEAGFNLNGTPSNYKIGSSYTNETGKMTIKFSIGGSLPTFANFHIHPGQSTSGMPSTPGNNYEGNKEGDTGMVDRIYSDYGQAVQIYIMSWKGLSMYDPKTKAPPVLLVKGTGFLKGSECPH